MADLLRIRKGLFGSLPTDKVAGTIYVTTDEKAMYVDVDNSTRIRLGQIIEVKNLTEWQNLKPPYSQEGFYYIVDDNALIKYTGNGTTHSWQQINAPTDLSDLESDIQDLQALVGNSDTEGLRKKIADNSTAIAENASDIAQNTSDIAQNASDISTLKGTIGKDDTEGLRLRIKNNETDIGNLKIGVSDLNTLVGTKDDASTADTAFGRIKKNAENTTTNTSNINKLRTDLGTNDKNDGSTAFSRIADLEESVGTNTSNITKNANAIKTLQSSDTTQNASIEKLNTTVYGSADGNTNTDSGLVNKVEALRTDLGNKSEDNDGSGSAFARIADLRSKIDDNADAIGSSDDVASASGSLYARIKQNASDISGLNTTVNEQGEAIDDLTDRVKTAEDEIDALQGTVGDTTKGLVKQVTDLDAAINGNTGILKTIGSSADPASASGSLYARIAYNKNQIESNDTDITNLGALIGTRSDAQADKTAFQLIDEKVDKTTYATDKAALEQKIDDEINAANSMTFITGVSKAADLPSTAKKGDTYVVEEGFGAYEPGDLLIATGDETATDSDGNTYIPASGLTWTHVKTGYNESHQDSLIGANNAISLTSYIGTPLGSVAFESKTVNGKTSALTVSVANDKVTLAVEWEDF